jgi:hypothetical protein
MEKRRQELLADQTGYWAQRMQEEQQRALLAAAIGSIGGGDGELDAATALSLADATSLTSTRCGGGGS